MRSPAVCLLLQARLIPYSKKYMDILLEVYLRSLSSLRCLISFLHLKSVYFYLPTGWSMWFISHRRAPLCHDNSDRVFSNGVWVPQTTVFCFLIKYRLQPYQSFKSLLYSTGTSLPWESGYQAQTNQNPCRHWCQSMIYSQVSNLIIQRSIMLALQICVWLPW